MAIVTRKDISVAYNKVIADFISKGYILSPFTYNGYGASYSYCTDLVSDDNKEIIRVWLALEKAVFTDDNYNDVEVPIVNIKPITYPFDGKFYGKDLSLNSSDSSKVRIISEKKFYLIQDFDYRYVDSKNEMRSVLTKRNSRKLLKNFTVTIDNIENDKISLPIDVKKVPLNVIITALAVSVLLLLVLKMLASID